MSAVRIATLLSLFTASATWTIAQDDTSERKRGISDNLASALSETMPKYTPPPPQPAKTEEDTDEEASEEANALGIKPKNGIVRLPRVVVEGSRPPVFTEREVNTDKGLAEIATKRYFADASQALNKFHVPFLTMSQQELAMMMWEEDERLRLLEDYRNQADMAELQGDSAEAKELRTLTNDTLGRRDYLPDASALHRETKGN